MGELTGPTRDSADLTKALIEKLWKDQVGLHGDRLNVLDNAHIDEMQSKTRYHIAHCRFRDEGDTNEAD